MTPKCPPVSPAIRALLWGLLLCSAGLPPGDSFAQDVQPAPQDTPVEVEAPPSAAPVPIPTADPDPDPDPDFDLDFDLNADGRRNRRDAVVAVGGDAVLPADRRADSVVAVFGNARSLGTVDDSVVAVFGNVRVEGPVDESVVALLGNVYINSRVEEAVAVFGNLELGPEARIDRNLLVIGGTLVRAPGAEVRGQVEHIAASGLPDLSGLHAWVREGLAYGRPLALDADLRWAWVVALSVLALYAIAALLFGRSVDHCIRTLESHPGRSAVTALGTLLLTPMLMVLLTISLIGIAAIPFLVFGLILASVFGKIAVLGWLGRRCLAPADPERTFPVVWAVLLGGALVLAAYAVPVLGFMAFGLLGFLGLGVVLYTLLLHWQAAHPPAAAATAAATAAAPSAPAAPAPAPVAPPGTPPAFAATGEAADVGVDLDLASLPRAGFWIRMGALAIDTCLVSMIMIFIDAGPGILILLAAYGAILWKIRGTTVGGIICNLQVVRIDARPIDWPTAVVRALGCFVSLAFAGLGFMWVAIDPDRQSWHDKIAGTAVVLVPKGRGLV